MPQVARELAPHRSARHFFGAELRYWRLQRDLAQADLAAQVHVSDDLIAKIEKAQRWPTASLAAGCDDILDTGGILARLWPLVDHERRGDSLSRPLSSDAEDRLATIIASVLPNSGLHATSDEPASWTMRLPAGHALPTTQVPVDLRAATSEGADRITVTSSGEPPVAPPGPRRLLVVEEVIDAELRFYAAERRRLSVRRAYQLDALTIGILWAVCGTDDALLSDDATLAESRQARAGHGP